MHEETLKRDYNRYARNRKNIEKEIGNVCLECSKGHCQNDAVSRILKDSRIL